MKKILVTGGAGYVGAVLVPKLIADGYTVTVLDWYLYQKDVFEAYRGEHLIELVGDLRDATLVDKAVKNQDAVIHLACISNDPSFELDPTLGKSINYDATVQLIEKSVEAGVKRFIYASSSSVYGVKEEKEVTEDLPLAPLTDYSKYKALCEPILLSKRSRIFTPVALRPSTVCGYSPRLRLDLTVNMLTLQALVNKKITVFGGSQFRPNIHIEDMADAYRAFLKFEDKDIAGEIFNVGYENYSVQTIAEMVKLVVDDPTVEIVISPSNDLRSYHVSSKKIAKKLGFIPKRTVEDAIYDLVTAYKAGKIPNALTDPKYVNIKMMQEFGKR